MARRFHDWIKAYLDYSGERSEAPRRIRFWAAVSCLAGALQRKVWIDQIDYEYHTNFYIIIVAPPGVARKTTSIDVAHSLLRELEGIHWGPDSATWQSLVTSLAAAKEKFILPDGSEREMNAITIASGEFGTLFNPDDREMIDVFVTLWDSRRNPFVKTTKHSGNDTIVKPWINMIACTTPSWIEGYFPEYMVGGGFTSRCVFIYAEQKERRIAYPKRHASASTALMRQYLVEDLRVIAELKGEYELTEETYKWGEEWYERLETAPRPIELEGDRFVGYLSRKQTMLHKLGMVLAAAQRDDLVLLPEDLQVADTMLKDMEKDLPKVFEKIGKSPDSVHSERIVHYVRSRGVVSYMDVYRFGQAHFADARRLDSVLTALLRAGKLLFQDESGKMVPTGEVRPGAKVFITCGQ